MKKHKKIVIVALVTVVAVTLAGCITWWGISQNKISNGGPQAIKGRVTNISNDCFNDGRCSITLDDSKVIVTGCGLMANGKTCKSYDQSKLHKGQQIEAEVMKDDSGRYNLECDSCMIRIIE